METANTVLIVVIVLEVIFIIGLIYLSTHYSNDRKEAEKAEGVGCPQYLCRGPDTQDGSDYFPYRLSGTTTVYQKPEVGNLNSVG